MPNFRYAGGAPAKLYHHSRVVDFSAYGQLVELSDDAVKAAWSGRLFLLPAAEFSQIHTPEDLRKYSRFETHARADADFLQRRSRAWDAARSIVLTHSR